MNKKPKMTYAQFLAALRKTPRDWRICAFGPIRRYPEGGHQQCPVSSLGNAWVGLSAVAAYRLGMPDALALRIMHAADSDRRTKTRRDLLKACGLDKK